MTFSVVLENGVFIAYVTIKWPLESTYEHVASGKWDICSRSLVFTLFCFIRFSFFFSFWSTLSRWMYALQWRKLWGQDFHDRVWTWMPALERSEPACSRIHSFQVSHTGKEVPCLPVCSSTGHFMSFRYFYIPQEVNIADVFEILHLRLSTWLQVKYALLLLSKRGPSKSDSTTELVRNAESQTFWIWICVLTRVLADLYVHSNLRSTDTSYLYIFQMFPSALYSFAFPWYRWDSRFPNLWSMVGLLGFCEPWMSYVFLYQCVFLGWGFLTFNRFSKGIMNL